MNICLVTSEVLGATKNGGIATATSHLSVLLATKGHQVTLLYVGQNAIDPSDPWHRFHAVAGVNVIAFRGDYQSISPEWMKQPVQVFEQLRFTEFDVILFQDRLALGHSCMIAKRCGLAFENTILAVIAFGSTSWLTEANQSFVGSKAELAISHMEQQAVELADALVSPSAYLIEWMRSAGWTLPKRISILPYFLDSLQFLGAEHSIAGRLRSVSSPAHLVFFGRFEERKGISIFLAALASSELVSLTFQLTFLGSPASKSIEVIRQHIEACRPDLLEFLEFKTDLTSDQAQAFLLDTNCVCVIPSLTGNSPCVIYELLKFGLPFIAADSGGIPELLHPDVRERCLFAPTAKALASKLRELLTSDAWPAARPSFTTDQIAADWLTWFESARSQAGLPPAAVSPRAPEITVIVTHYERPHLVSSTLQALALQTDPRFEVLLVDDGSNSESALNLLNQLEGGFEGLTLRIIRQPNKYLGAARNEGLRRARTPYVIFLDDDNVPFPTMVEVLRRAAHYSNADIITCQMQLFDKPVEEPDIRELELGPRWAFSSGPLVLSSMMNCYGDATGIYKRELFEQVGYFHELYGITHEDWELHLRSAMSGKTMVSLPLPLFWYRMSADSMIRSTSFYRNMQVISSVFKKQVPAYLTPLFDFMIGREARS